MRNPTTREQRETTALGPTEVRVGYVEEGKTRRTYFEVSRKSPKISVRDLGALGKVVMFTEGTTWNADASQPHGGTWNSNQHIVSADIATVQTFDTNYYGDRINVRVVPATEYVR